MKRFCLFIAFLAMVLCVDAARKVTWVIDAGHGGRDVGCEGRLLQEKDITLAVAKEVAKLVKKNLRGVRVVLTRESDKYLTLQERCDIANNRGAALFISIHVNSAANQFARGTESFFATNVPLKGSQSGKSELLALLLQRQYLSHGRQVSRGVKQRELYVCEHTNMPSVLTEIGFISNLNEEAYLNSKDGQRELADAIYQALAEWKEKTKDGTVSRRDLRNLRFSHYDPISLVPTDEPILQLPTAEQPSAATTAIAPGTGETTPQGKPAEDVAPETAATQEQQAKDSRNPTEGTVAAAASTQTAPAAVQPKGKEAQAQPAAAKDKAPAAAPKDKAPAAAAKDKAPAAAKDSVQATTATRPYFAIQLMNTSTRLKEGDYRLKGFTPSAQIPSGDRFKIIYGHSESYKEIKNALAEVRETFPEAFIVAFLGERQITTAEALQLLKK